MIIAAKGYGNNNTQNSVKNEVDCSKDTFSQLLTYSQPESEKATQLEQAPLPQILSTPTFVSPPAPDIELDKPENTEPGLPKQAPLVMPAEDREEKVEKGSLYSEIYYAASPLLQPEAIISLTLEINHPQVIIEPAELPKVISTYVQHTSESLAKEDNEMITKTEQFDQQLPLLHLNQPMDKALFSFKIKVQPVAIQQTDTITTNLSSYKLVTNLDLSDLGEIGIELEVKRGQITHVHIQSSKRETLATLASNSELHQQIEQAFAHQNFLPNLNFSLFQGYSNQPQFAKISATPRITEEEPKQEHPPSLPWLGAAGSINLLI